MLNFISVSDFEVSFGTNASLISFSSFRADGFENEEVDSCSLYELTVSPIENAELEVEIQDPYFELAMLAT